MIGGKNDRKGAASNDVKEDDGEVNRTLLAVNFKVTQTERQVGAAFINLHSR